MMLTPNYLHNGTVPSNGTFTLNPANDSSLWRTKSDMLDKNSDGHFHAGIDLPFDNQDKEEGETPDNPDLGLDDSFNSFYSPCQ